MDGRSARSRGDALQSLMLSIHFIPAIARFGVAAKHLREQKMSKMLACGSS
ncbi:hypothetical protein RSSM_05769 [Rhodopirellula sallentina SM41]|uniref:Uncharacterized protein n=1 Tax=Rhodopirellula sallentina SM41 TaxID=1263870 RepID=M5U4K4_9BACT|nr:hypothetical protein RSSM_05769 [Rhodopirellula sallentina SM41]